CPVHRAADQDLRRTENQHKTHHVGLRVYGAHHVHDELDERKGESHLLRVLRHLYDQRSEAEDTQHHLGRGPGKIHSELNLSDVPPEFVARVLEIQEQIRPCPAHVSDRHALSI